MYNSSGVADYRYKYFYDNSGNLVNWYINNNDNTETYENHTYTYGNTSWADLLTAFDGYGIAYEGQTYNSTTNTVTGTAVSGNPISYYNGTRWTFAWGNGRQLTSASKTGTSISYAYDLNGLRTSKTVGTKTYTYVYAGGKLLQQTDGTNTWNFAYAANGNPFSLTYNGTTYYYITNLQGDVMYLVNATGTRVAAYTYDPYGRVLTATGSMASINPLRYRGYYYDTETGFYYLQSRYYNSAICRFINADNHASTGQSLVGYNIFAYCTNNPINGYDPSGEWDLGGILFGATLAVAGVLLVAACVATAGTAAPLATAAIMAAGTAVGTGMAATGAVVTAGAITEEPIVVDITVTDGSTHSKKGYSCIVDCGSDTVDIYYHHGVTTSSSSSITYGVGFVANYDEVGDYGGHFIDASASTTYRGMDYGIDACTDPTRIGDEGASAVLATVGFGLPGPGRNIPVAFSYDYYVPVSVYRW